MPAASISDLWAAWTNSSLSLPSTDLSKPDKKNFAGMSTGIPDSFLAKFTINPPPAGLKSNFVDPPDAGWIFIIVGAVLLLIMSIFLGIRIYSELFIIQKSSWDDCRYHSFQNHGFEANPISQ